VSAPAVVIVLALEEPTVVYFDALGEGETHRLLDWLNPEQLDLLDRASEMADRERTA
jgi:hypothetical protein